MKTFLGAGWYLWHLTDRVIELRKACPVRRRITGRDGFVRLRAEPGMDRNWMIHKAVELAREDDARWAEFAARDVLPSTIRRHQVRLATLATVFATPEEPERRVYRP